MANSDLSRSSSMALPRVLIVSRRALRKNKFVDFVGEYHLDLIVRFGAVPVIVPRVPKIDTLLQSFEPFHGLLLCEGEDIDPSLYNAQPSSTLSTQQLDHIRKLHPSDTSIDKHKDSIELNLTKLCLQRNIPILGICRGSQILNVSCGGTLYQDVEMEMMFNGCDSDDGFERVCHINYEDYDGHRHLVRVMEDCPLGVWFNDSMKEDGGMEIMVNSYHHQGVKRLAQRFVPMAFSPDGLIEGFYDPQVYDPEEGKFIVGLQFHPERMRQPDSDDFDYPGCPMVYQEFVKAVIAHEKKLSCSAFVPRAPNPSEELELKRRIIMKSLSVARNVYKCGCEMVTNQHPQLEPREDFLDVYHMEKSLENTALSLQQEKRLKQVVETVKNGSEYTQKMKMMQEKEKVASNMMENMYIEQLSELMSFYQLMGHLCSETLERKLNELLLQE